ncbi:SPP1 gp7 family putative phage head morphogenesis protein [Variovorax boronicumulans]|uniref:phage head morphogenesis protein n=1 Tax=Variovorax boronicumulans TaxID=436515 RepID=UPI00277E125E|nr:phage minor head protein [Variovorax boronicumulans]MDP9990922.1 SPP1 gp7 family putative phage head morphogenesis protein [Variovorax boronicumulans]MDQ0002950.1 SPP1 gp7 family putative phage head morphogenesis protein [Variovorax boronicumulans]
MPDAMAVGGFGVKFGEAIDYLKGKLPETSQAHDDLAGPVHGKVFTVTGATKTDLVRDLHRSITSAIENGTTITDFRKDFDKAVQQHGWQYKGKRGWRTSVIFDTNMRSARMAGRWKQLQDGKDRRPFLQYRTAGDARVRPQHRQWNSLIYAVDDAFWQTHYPPNGWGCRCTVRAYSQADLDRKELEVSPPFETKTREVITRDGEIKDRVPVGIDPGWDHNVGQAWLSPEVALGQKLARLPRELQGIVTDKTITPAFEKVMNDNFKALRKPLEQGVKAVPEPAITGFLDSSTLNGLAQAAPDLALSSTAVTVANARALGAASPWPVSWVDELPSNLRNYRAVLRERASGSLLVIPQGLIDGALPVATIRLNQQTKFGQAAQVVELGKATAAALGDVAAYELVVGSLPKVAPAAD